MLSVVITSLLGLSLIVIEISRSLPELMRVKHAHSVDGLSTTGQGVLLGTIPVWIAVAIIEGGPWILAAGIVWVIFHSLLVQASYSVDKQFGRKVFRTALISAAITYPTVIIVGTAMSFSFILGVFLIAATAAYSFPALIAGLKSVTTKGLSVLSLAINTFEGLIYTAGGLGLITLTSGEGITVSYMMFGLIAALSNGPRLVRTSYRRLNKLE